MLKMLKVPCFGGRTPPKKQENQWFFIGFEPKPGMLKNVKKCLKMLNGRWC